MKKSAVARQVNDYMVQNPNTIFVVVTGTCDVEGIMDYGHLLDWCLRDRSPLPREERELQEWSDVIDGGDMGVQARWVCNGLGIPLDSGLEAIREAYRERLVTTPGLIIEDTPFDGVPLTVEEHVIDPGCDAHFAKLRDLWIRPDGVELTPGSDTQEEDTRDDRVQGSTIWPVARRMARGLCYVWDPLPPEDWMAARRSYFAWVRRVLEEGTFYTELQARRHAEANSLPAWKLWWTEVKDTYTPNQKTLWLSDAALDFCIQWGAQGPGVIWTEDTAFATELERRTGWVYYGGKGMSSTGLSILAASGSSVVIASRRANGTGRNLQHQWHRCLFTVPPNKSRDFEQAAGRFHREGQVFPVHVDILLACAEDFSSIGSLLASARRTEKSLYSQKAASIQWPRAERPSDSSAAFRS